MTDLSFIIPRQTTFCWIFNLLLLIGCSNTSDKPSILSDLSPKLSSQTAATTPVKNNPGLSSAESLRLANTEKLIQAGDHQAAQMQIDLIDANRLPAELRSKYNLLDAEISLSQMDAEHALVMLETAKPNLLSTNDQISYYQSLAFAHALLEQILPAANARIRLNNLLQNGQQQIDNGLAIIDLLNKLPLTALEPTQSNSFELNGWLALTKILKQSHEIGYDITEPIAVWRQKFPKHKANGEFLKNYLARPKLAENPLSTNTNLQQKAFVGVFLPASGKFAAAGKAVKEGILAAYKNSSLAEAQIQLKFYDTEQSNIVVLYHKAVTEGAQYIIGPLIKEQVQALADSRDLKIPVLALNQVENLIRPNLYQFGLSPIDEAEQLVLKARQSGKQSALILTPNHAQGQRIAHYLAAAWQAQGGNVITTQTFEPAQSDFADSVTSLVNAYNQAGQSAPVLLLSINPEAGRKLLNEIKKYPALNLDIYAMPNIYAGHTDPEADMELNHINFCDMPWLFDIDYKNALPVQSFSEIWKTLGDNQIRLVALGIDAVNLINHLPSLAMLPYAGATGKLSLNAENRVKRKLVCLQFEGGLPIVNYRPD